MAGICEKRGVIVTGAGSGLGRAYALAFATEGARVVVNDWNAEQAQAVVEEIRAAGGAAWPNQDDVADYQGAARAVQTAIKEAGALDVLVNNAGVVRDRMFVNTSEEEWDAVLRVHLRGHYCMGQNACRYWRDEHKAGRPRQARLINTSSGAGLQGSIGQANYSAAKGGIATLTLVQAVELARYGITANALVPAARTTMTEQAFAERMRPPQDGSFDYFDPANVAPLVVWLGSAASAAISGRVFEIEGGRISIADGWRSGAMSDKGARWEVGEIGAVVEELLQNTTPAQKVYGS